MTGLDLPIGIALDVGAGKMYWTDRSMGVIQRANLDGSGVETLLSGLSSLPLDISLDVQGGKMYWTAVRDRIQRANLDGTTVEILRTGLSNPAGIALDVTTGKMYWTETIPVGRVSSYVVRRANLDGSGVETLLGGVDSAGDIALDVEGGEMYWIVESQILRANLDGSGVEGLVGGLDAPEGIALDPRVTYDTWTSRSVDAPPHDPIHDCVRLGEKTISTELCGDSGPLLTFPLLSVPEVDLWIGQVPCQGQNLVFVGTSLEGEIFPLGGNIIGASVLGLTQGTTLGLEGVHNPDCSVAPSKANSYAVETAAPTSDEAVDSWSGLSSLGNAETLSPGPAGTGLMVANKTYEVWFSRSFDAPPFVPLRDCWHFTDTTMTTDQCGDVGPLVEFPLFGASGFSLWIGQVPCQGQNLIFFGTSYDGAIFPLGGNVVSATGVGVTQGFTLAAEGFENPSCSIVP